MLEKFFGRTERVLRVNVCRSCLPDGIIHIGICLSVPLGKRDLQDAFVRSEGGWPKNWHLPVRPCLKVYLVFKRIPHLEGLVQACRCQG